MFSTPAILLRERLVLWVVVFFWGGGEGELYLIVLFSHTGILLLQEPNRINKEGELVVQSNRFRNQQKNLEDGIKKLREIFENVSYIPKETAEEKKAKISEM